MRHVNPNMIRPVLKGIENGEISATENGDWIVTAYYARLEELTDELTPKGDRPFVVGAFLKAKELAEIQGFIGAYRSATL